MVGLAVSRKGNTAQTHLALASLGVLPVLLLHGVRHTHEVLLHSRVLYAVHALLKDIYLLSLVGVDGDVDGSPAPVQSTRPGLIRFTQRQRKLITRTVCERHAY